MLSVVSPHASMSVKQGTVQAVLTKPEMFWATSASADSKARAGKVSQRQIWHGGDLEVNVEKRTCQVGVTLQPVPLRTAVHGNLGCYLLDHCYDASPRSRGVALNLMHMEALLGILLDAPPDAAHV